MKYNLLIIDDHPIVREGLLKCLNDDLFKSIAVSTTQEANKILKKTSINLIIVDLSLEGENGIDFIKEMKIKYPSIPILVFTMHDVNIYAERIIKAGAKGYIMKGESLDILKKAILTVLKGNIYLNEKIKNKILTKYLSGFAMASSPLEVLSDREFEIFQLIGTGLSNNKIAEKLKLSIKTIESHQTHIKKKMVIDNYRELLQKAYLWAATGNL